MRCVLPLGLLALGASMDVGEKNLATAKRDLELGEGDENSIVSGAFRNIHAKLQCSKKEVL